MFSFLDKITFDPRSGRPIAPVFWQLTTFYVIMGWLNAIIIAATALLVRHDQPELSLTLITTALFLFGFVERQRRKVRVAQAQFRQMVQDYEDMLSESRIG